MAKPEPKGRRSLRAGDRTNSSKQGSTVRADREGSSQGTSSSGSSEHPENGCWGARYQTVRRGLATPPLETGGRAFSDGSGDGSAQRGQLPERSGRPKEPGSCGTCEAVG